MASIDPSQQSLSAILNKLGINSAEKSNVPKSKDQLGQEDFLKLMTCLLYTSPSPRDGLLSRMPSSA